MRTRDGANRAQSAIEEPASARGHDDRHANDGTAQAARNYCEAGAGCEVLTGVARDIACSIALRVRERTLGLSMRAAHVSMMRTSNPAGSSSSGIWRARPRWATLA